MGKATVEGKNDVESMLQYEDVSKPSEHHKTEQAESS